MVWSYLYVDVALRNISELNHRIEAEGPRHMPLSRKEMMCKSAMLKKPASEISSLNQGVR